MSANLVKFLISTVYIALFFNPLHGKTIRVPRDFSTIGAAIKAASDGDVVEVDDGYYFEKNVAVDKAILLKSRNLFGAVIDGGGDSRDSIFLIQTSSEVSGFILKNAGFALKQRDSLDVTWTAHDIVILDSAKGISINDREANVGSALVYDIIVANSGVAFSTNDARRFEVRDSLVVDSDMVFAGLNHYSFSADRVTFWNCAKILSEENIWVAPPATNLITLGPDVISLDGFLNNGSKKEALDWVGRAFEGPNNDSRVPAQVLDLESVTLNFLGDAYLRLQEYDRADFFYSRALAVGENTGSVELTWNSHLNLGRLNISRNKPLQALDHLRKSIEVLEGARARLDIPEQRSMFLTEKRTVYEVVLDLLERLHGEEPDGGFARQAFGFMERFKARAFLDSLQESEIPWETQLLPAANAEKDVILSDISSIQILLRQPGLTKVKRQALKQELSSREDDFSEWLIRQRYQNPKFVNLVSPQPLPLPRIRRELLDEKTVLVSYLLGKNGGYAFFVSIYGLRMFRLPDENAVMNLVVNYLEFLKLRTDNEFLGTTGGVRLYNMLLGPVDSFIHERIERLLIIPDGILHYLPFEALIRPLRDSSIDTNTHPGFLVHDVSISYGPSATALTKLKFRSAPSTAPKDLLAVANNGSSPGSTSLAHAAREVRLIAGNFPKDRRMLLINRTATEKNIKSARLGDYRILHFATHGILDDEHWQRSALILRTDAAAMEDGLLQPKDLFSLDLNADLVVISACHSRGGKLESGEGILGLTRAFHFAGARAVTASLWKIDDRVTPFFMKHFYLHLTSGVPKDLALRQTKLEMLNSKYSHPRYWASFVLIGDSAALGFRQNP